MGEVVVTSSMRAALEASKLSGIEFREVEKVHVVRLSWAHWDKDAKLPPSLPTSGEPEDFLAGTHDAVAADELGDLWELVVGEYGRVASKEITSRRPLRYRFRLAVPKGSVAPDFFRPHDLPHIMVTQTARDWLEANYPAQVEFDVAVADVVADVTN